MLNFAEQTGSGAVMIVWSFLLDTTALYTMTFSTPLQNFTQYHPSFHPSPGPPYYLRHNPTQAPAMAVLKIVNAGATI